VPAPVERSTYVLFSSAALLLLFWKWQPMGGVVWNVGAIPGDWLWRLFLPLAG
jgi:methanethiol S-methyltransferase